MSDGESPSPKATEESGPQGSTARPTFSEARATLEQARRLYRAAEFIQARRLLGGVDSAVTAERALRLVLRLLLRLRGEPQPETFADLAVRASDVAREENLLAEDLRADLEIIAEMRSRLFEEREVTPAEDRRYDRAFLRCAEWFGAVEGYVKERVPRDRARLGMPAQLAIFAVTSFVLGVVVGRQDRHRAVPLPEAGIPASSANVEGPAFTATFFRDTVLAEPVLTRRDSSVAFDWGSKAPAESVPSDGFSVRWEGNLRIRRPGKYTFFLTSDDGSRCFLDGSLLVDNWGSHSEHTEESTVELSEGTHKLRVEFFDKVGPAEVRLEWRSEEMSRRLVTSADLI